jgi:CRP/FNR family cyclic AMP-dependent transcriptional regulator
MRTEVERLRRVPLFGELSKRDLRALIRKGRELEFAEGRSIVREGSKGSDFYLILSGDATVSRGGRKLARLGAGDFFGEVALLDGGPRSATIVADTPVLTFRLSRPDFLELVARESSISRKILEEAGRRVRRVERPTRTL